VKALALSASIFLVACGGANEALRTAVVVTAAGVVEVDETAARIAADTRESHGDQADREFPDQPDAARSRFLELRAPFWKMDEVVTGVGELLFSAEAFLDAHGSSGFEPVAACIVRGLGRLSDAGKAIGLEMPEVIQSGFALLEGLEGRCDVEGEGDHE